MLLSMPLTRYLLDYYMMPLLLYASAMLTLLMLLACHALMLPPRLRAIDHYYAIILRRLFTPYAAAIDAAYAAAILR